MIKPMSKGLFGYVTAFQFDLLNTPSTKDRTTTSRKSEVTHTHSTTHTLTHSPMHSYVVKKTVEDEECTRQDRRSKREAKLKKQESQSDQKFREDMIVQQKDQDDLRIEII